MSFWIILILLVVIGYLLYRQRDRTTPPAPLPQRSFMPGQFCVLVGLDTAERADEAAKSVQEELRRIAVKFDTEVVISPERMVALDTTNQHQLLIVGEAPSLRSSPERLIAFVRQVNEIHLDESLREVVTPPVGDNDPYIPGEGKGRNPRVAGSAASANAAPRTTTVLGDAIAPSELPAFRIRVASLNWLIGGTPQGTGGGGPGARPYILPTSEASSVNSRSTTPTAPWTFTVLANIEPPSSRSNRDVIVAVLDTVQRPGKLRQAYDRWVALQPSGSEHALLKLLVTDETGAFAVGPTAPLDVLLSPTDIVVDTDDTVITDHDYLMPDHGLFVAGIIRSLAQDRRVRIKMIETLGAFGLGTSESIARGFRQLLELRKENLGVPIVANCSLMLLVPSADAKALETANARSGDLKELQVQDAADMSLFVKAICDQLAKDDVVIVAAAGNDSDNDPDPNYHFPARYPAAFPSVVGVGSVTANSFKPTVYSNIADAPNSDGYATIGGDVTASVPPESAPTTGLLGVYLHETTPAGTGYNDTGWARWAGTSFATPVIAGILADRISKGDSPGAALAALEKAAERAAAGDLGDLVRVQQG